MLDFEGDTAPYVLYTYARIRSILRKAVASGFDPEQASDEDLATLDQPEEFEIARQLEDFGAVVCKAAEDYEPFYLTRHISTLARAFNKYYNNHSILAAGEPQRVRARLALCVAVTYALQTGTWLLGIDVVERM